MLGRDRGAIRDLRERGVVRRNIGQVRDFCDERIGAGGVGSGTGGPGVLGAGGDGDDEWYENVRLPFLRQQIAKREGLHHSTVNELLRLTLLEPAIVQAIGDGISDSFYSVVKFGRAMVTKVVNDWTASQTPTTTGSTRPRALPRRGSNAPRSSGWTTMAAKSRREWP